MTPRILRKRKVFPPSGIYCASLSDVLEEMLFRILDRQTAVPVYARGYALQDDVSG